MGRYILCPQVTAGSLSAQSLMKMLKKEVSVVSCHQTKTELLQRA